MEYPRKNGLCYDPIEDTEEYKEAMKKIQEELDERMEGIDGMGSCHIYWRHKKQLLARFRVEWKSPKECNPFVMFD